RAMNASRYWSLRLEIPALCLGVLGLAPRGQDYAGLALGLQRLAGGAGFRLGETGEAGAVLAVVLLGRAAGVVEVLAALAADHGQLLASVRTVAERAHLHRPAFAGSAILALGFDDLDVRVALGGLVRGEHDLQALIVLRGLGARRRRRLEEVLRH